MRLRPVEDKPRIFIRQREVDGVGVAGFGSEGSDCVYRGSAGSEGADPARGYRQRKQRTRGEQHRRGEAGRPVPAIMWKWMLGCENELEVWLL